MATAIDPRADSGFSNAASYDTYRPSYPAEAISALLTRLNIAGKAGARIVEVGAGTGKFTEALAARQESFEIIAVEPQNNMRKELVAKTLKGVKVIEGTAAKMNIDEGWADAVVIAQAFHWFATEESLRKIHSVLKPGAALGLIWNVDDWNTPVSWPCVTVAGQAIKTINESMEDGHARFRHLKWKNILSTEFEKPLFKQPLQEDRNVKWTVYLTDEAIWKRLSTVSTIENLDPEKRENIKRQILEVLKGDGVERNEKSEVALHGLTYFAWIERV